ncbi:MAG TPA: EAL domain-containing protein [Leptolyngbyaceae cyanobacterium M33_DOE_097]|uniref:histidine kinase n=1 Tax=Oscillatoriales cyanobacterium SpSt-418 TaxID=2282169 RepID=A0A7C3KCK5_9CYAN|nr:EAL domain-containing protein [Leptolyngbyaceae cyanobacterium M33_DOE_097]
MTYFKDIAQVHQKLQTLDHLTEKSEDISLFVSHELRTPLTSIQGVLGLLQSGQLGELSEEGYRLLSIALNNTTRLTRLASALEHERTPAITLLSSTDIEQLQLENELHQALDLKQFQLVYQPIMEVSSEQIASFEALIRWQHPTRGVISPVVFIPLAERIGIITKVGFWVLEQACYQLASWQQQFPDSSVSVSVNLSVLQLLQPDLLQQVQQVLQKTNVKPESLKLEITETTLIGNQELAIASLSQLRKMGLQVYVDDFGTGYSSLARLQDLPIDALKIDRSFIRSKRWDISEMIIVLAAKLGLSAIAEGVETLEDTITLQKLGCQYMQGYFYSQPIDSETATQLLATYSKAV